LSANRAALELPSEAKAVIERWNEQLAASRDILWSPAIRAALIAGTPWIAGRAIDLRKVDRHPLTSVATLVLGLRCSWCPESAPMLRIRGRRPSESPYPQRNALLPFHTQRE
jgi:hypothetical protein